MNRTFIQILFLLLISCPFGFSQTTVKAYILKPATSQAKSDTLEVLQTKSVKELKQVLSQKITDLHKQGYIDAAFTSLKAQKKNTYIYELEKGKQFEYIHLKITDSLVVDLVECDLKIFNQTIKLPIVGLEEQLTRLNNCLANKGQPFLQIQVVKIQKQDNRLSATLEVKSSKKRQLDEIIIKGYTKFPRSFLKHRLQLITGKKFNKGEILEKYKEIQQLNFASSVKPPEILFQKDSTKLYLFLNKQQQNEFDGYLGFSNEEQGKFNLNGYLNLSLLNNFNQGEQINLSYLNNAESQLEFKIAAELPYLFNSPIGANLHFDLLRKDSTFTRNTFGAQIHYSIKNWKPYMGYTSIKSNQTQSSASYSQKANLSNYRVKFFQVGVRLDANQRKDFFTPPSYLNLGTSFGSRKATINSSQQIYTLQQQHFLQIGQRSGIRTHLTAHYLESKDYFINELSFFGGVNSFRGIEENSLTTNFYGLLQTEYRFKFASNFYLHSILDYGLYTPTPNSSLESLTSLGFGLALNTKAGKLEVMFANAKYPGTGFKFRNTLVHLRLQSRF